MTLTLGPVIGQIGGGVEMFEPAFTPNVSSTRRTLATQVVGEGQWLVAARVNREGFSAVSMWVNGVLIQGGTNLYGSSSTVAVVDGPGTITVEGMSISSGHVHIVRIA